MANLPAFDDAVTLARDEPELGVGIHLNLTCGKPLSRPNLIASLLDPSGVFYPLPRLMRRLALKKVNPQEIRLELKAQVQHVLKANITPTHLDTHQHIHFYPLVNKIVQDLAAEFGITWVRGSSRSLLRNMPWEASFFDSRGAFLSVGKMALLSSLRHLCPPKKTDAKRPDYLSGLFTAPAEKYSLYLKKILASLPDGITEFICHPGYVDDELKSLDSWIEMREIELETLISPEIRDTMQQKGITISHFAKAHAVNHPIPS